MHLRTRTLANRLRSTRRECNLTQTELGSLSGTNQAVIQKIENGISLRPRSINDIAKALKVNPAWLQFGEPWATKDVPQDADW